MHMHILHYCNKQQQDDQLRNDMTYSLSMASAMSDDTALSPLTKELNERQKEQLLNSKQQ